jgi:hypothetical protein
MPSGNGHNRAIVVVGDRATMQPGMERGTDFRRGQEKPDKQRQKPHRAVQKRPRSATVLKQMSHQTTIKKQQTGQNPRRPFLIANHLQ